MPRLYHRPRAAPVVSNALRRVRHQLTFRLADRSLRQLLSHSGGLPAEPAGDWWERRDGDPFADLAGEVSTRHQQALDAVERAARGGDNLVPPVIDAVERRATLGEIADTLRAVFGE